ncbi:MAG: zinc-binding dehydrogenase [Leptospirales bacterium]|nr:zinc-binding dehydrogenase [Leptospirales bacterium]
MRAYVVSRAGGPEVLELKEVPDPVAARGQALIGIRAFGLNRAEAVTRMGGSFDAVKFPRVIGIECVGEVLDCPGGELSVGERVAALMGGMGRAYDGSYAEKTVVPLSNVFALQTSLDWSELGAIPETYLTAWGCCFETLQLSEGARVLVRPGASALGIAIAQIVNTLNGSVIGITRSKSKVASLLQAGMQQAIVSDGAVADQVRNLWPDGPSGIVDTIASELSVADDLAMLSNSGGRLCLAGSLAESYGNSKSADFEAALSRADVAFYNTENLRADRDGVNLQTIVNRVEAGKYRLHTQSVMDFGELVLAHRQMDANEHCGKVVIRVA